MSSVENNQTNVLQGGFAFKASKPHQPLQRLLAVHDWPRMRIALTVAFAVALASTQPQSSVGVAK